MNYGPSPSPSDKGRAGPPHRSTREQRIWVHPPSGVLSAPPARVFLPPSTIPVPHLQGREQEVIQASHVDGVHHVTDQVDLGSQVLNSGRHPPPQ